ncbi:hypothetical protein HAX54_010185 [Datura stramonium]|uniref:Uncharacterized protein n=1 Tax=Datura stramonium TaxID=4076 RepID=A0ABS8THF5_DATST|nr:hypothetical protein [Datura stramonium]
MGDPNVKARITTHNGIPAVIFKSNDYYGAMAEECRIYLSTATHGIISNKSEDQCEYLCRWAQPQIRGQGQVWRSFKEPMEKEINKNKNQRKGKDNAQQEDNRTTSAHNDMTKNQPRGTEESREEEDAEKDENTKANTEYNSSNRQAIQPEEENHDHNGGTNQDEQ